VLIASLCPHAIAAGPDAPSLVPQGVEFLRKHCADCHAGDKPEADLRLDNVGDTPGMVRNRRRWEAVLRMLDTRQMPPADSPQPPHEEIEQFTKLVADIFEHHDRTAPPDPGRVTMRRLNRAEYNNTIRDLIGVDFNPAEDFPSDDIGHGFDNIGDVLSLSPVLLERYLAAAESITQRAILPNPPSPPKRHISCRYCEPAGRDVPESRYRPITSKADAEPIQSGPLFTRYQIPPGDFVFRAKLYAEAPEGQTVKIVVLACSPGLTDGAASDEDAARIAGRAVDGLRPFRIVETVEVSARDDKQAQHIEVRVPRIAGLDRMAVGLLRPADDSIEHKLHVEYLALEGPLDTRPESHHRIMACTPDVPRQEQDREILDRLASRAFRRPATPEEVDRLAELVASVEADGGSREEGIQFAAQAVLVSPKFLFRMELDENPTSPETRPLDDFQLASRLSYFLWSSMPDDELTTLARQGTLRDHLPAQVERMLADDRAMTLVDRFALQWLQLERLDAFVPDAGRFPGFDDRLRRSMREETRLFLAEVFQENRSIVDLLNADYTYLNETLARHYGIPFPGGDGSDGSSRRNRGRSRGDGDRGARFVRVELKDSPRGGLLTQASVLAVTSNPTRTSPVKRGKWVLEQLLGTPPPPPPPNVPELEGEARKLTGTLREQMEQHRASPACAACHASMDPLGFAFENFDAVGRWRDRDGESPINASGELPGGRVFNGPAELKRLLVDQKDLFTRCFTEKMLIFALGRGLEYYDRPTVNRIVRQVADSDYRLASVVTGIVTSDAFLKRRGGD